MRIQRVQRRSNWPLFGCIFMGMGCLVVGGFALILVLLPLLPGLALSTAGFTPRGSTTTLFENVEVPPMVQVQNATTAGNTVLNLGTYGTQILPENSVVVGSDASGIPVAVATFSEAALMNICYQRSTLCTTGSDQFRNLRLDLRPGGAVVYGDVSVPGVGLQQNIGMVLQLDDSLRQFRVVGVDVSGGLYDIPLENFGTLKADVERVGNEILRQLTLEAGGSLYTLRQVRIDDSQLTLVLD